MTALQTAEKRHAYARAVLDLRLENGVDTAEARALADEIPDD